MGKFRTVLWVFLMAMALGIANAAVAQEDGVVEKEESAVPQEEATLQDAVLKLKESIIDIQNLGKLDFRNFTLCSNVFGYGQYVPVPENKVEAGSEVYFYYEPVNLYTNRKDNAYQIGYTQDMILTSVDGEEFVNSPNALNFNHMTTSPVLDVYSTNTLALGNLPPGKYVFTAVIHDTLKKVDAKTECAFEVIAKPEGSDETG